MPNIKMGKGYIAIPDSINSKEDLEKIIKKGFAGTGLIY